MFGLRHVKSKLAERSGFVLPMAIFALVILSVMAVAALVTGDDEQRSAQAVRESAAAFYAAEAGLNAVWANWPDTLVSALEPGDSLDLGWQLHLDGSSYRPVILRLDNGSGQKLYDLTVEGRGAGPRGGQRVLSFSITAESSPGGGGRSTLPPWGGTGAVTGRGGWAASGNMAGIDGHDHIPPSWNDCDTDSMQDAPGVVWDDKSKVMKGNGGQIKGEPPVVEDPNLAQDSVYWKFGDVTFDELVAMAEYTIENTGDMGFGTQAKTSGGECLHPWQGSGFGTNYDVNLGSDNPSSPCYDYFPIVHLKGKNTLSGMSGGYAQGIFLVEGNFQLAQNARVRGIIIAKGCVTMGNSGSIYGAVLVDNTGGVSGCGGGGFMIGNASQSYWSSCAVGRTIENAGVDFNIGGDGEDNYVLVGSRAFGEMLR